jgi:hypothetical protein
MNRKQILILATLAAAFTSTALHAEKCEANINGFKIHNVFIAGDHRNGVIWAYKHLAEETCLTPTTNLSEADAILEVSSLNLEEKSQLRNADASFTVSCRSQGTSSYCSDSAGNALSTSCNASGYCTSSYGPGPYQVVGDLLHHWIDTRPTIADARLYTTDHKLLWDSKHQKGDWMGAIWPDLVRLGTNSPVCKCGSFQRSKYKNFRHWASERCGVEFDPLVSIDMKLREKQAAEQQKQDAANELVENAREAARKQQEKQAQQAQWRVGG